MEYEQSPHESTNEDFSSSLLKATKLILTDFNRHSTIFSTKIETLELQLKLSVQDSELLQSRLIDMDKICLNFDNVLKMEHSKSDHLSMLILTTKAKELKNRLMYKWLLKYRDNSHTKHKYHISTKHYESSLIRKCYKFLIYSVINLEKCN
jgi:hypothetical protein